MIRKEITEEQLKEAEFWLKDIDAKIEEDDLPLLLASFGNEVNESKYPIHQLINITLENINKTLTKFIPKDNPTVNVNINGDRKYCFSEIVSELSLRKYTNRFGESSRYFKDKIQLMTNDGWEITHVTTHGFLLWKYDRVYLKQFKFKE